MFFFQSRGRIVTGEAKYVPVVPLVDFACAKSNLKQKNLCHQAHVILSSVFRFVFLTSILLIDREGIFTCNGGE